MENSDLYVIFQNCILMHSQSLNRLTELDPQFVQLNKVNIFFKI